MDIRAELRPLKIRFHSIPLFHLTEHALYTEML